MQIALAKKLVFSPNIAQVTAVWSPCGLNVNSAVLVPGIGLTKSSRMRMNSAGRLCVTVMEPSPTSLLPAHLKTAPSPAGAPAYSAFAFGSSFDHGDQFSQLWKSFTLANTLSAGAATTVERSTLNSDGCMATMPANTAIA